MKTATRRRSLLAAIGIITAALLAACSSGTAANDPTGTPAAEPSFSTVKEGVLTVAPYGSSPPVIEVNPDKSLDGLLGKLFTGFAEKYGLKVELFETTFSSALLATQQGRADVTPFIYYTPERATTTYFSSSTFQLPAAAITMDDFDYTGPESLDGKRIAAVVGQVWAPYLQEAFGDNVQLFQQAPEAAQALLNGQVDVYVNSSLQTFAPPLAGRDDVVAHSLKVGDFDMPESVITNVAYNTFSCDNPELAQAMDDYLAELQASGEWKTINDDLGIPEDFQIMESSAPEQGC